MGVFLSIKLYPSEVSPKFQSMDANPIRVCVLWTLLPKYPCREYNLDISYHHLLIYPMIWTLEKVNRKVLFLPEYRIQGTNFPNFNANTISCTPSQFLPKFPCRNSIFYFRSQNHTTCKWSNFGSIPPPCCWLRENFEFPAAPKHGELTRQVFVLPKEYFRQSLAQMPDFRCHFARLFGSSAQPHSFPPNCDLLAQSQFP